MDAPFIVMCGSCRRVVSDSYQLLFTVADLDALVLDAAVGVRSEARQTRIPAFSPLLTRKWHALPRPCARRGGWRPQWAAAARTQHCLCCHARLRRHATSAAPPPGLRFEPHRGSEQLGLEPGTCLDPSASPRWNPALLTSLLRGVTPGFERIPPLQLARMQRRTRREMCLSN